jgi:tetratricopeptide (TPR) repeat protein
MSGESAIMKTKYLILPFYLVLAGCGHNNGSNKEQSAEFTPKVTPLSVLLVPQTGDTKLDTQIRQAQEQVRSSKTPEPELERLGWLFVAKARTTFDPGFYKLGEQCALCLEAKNPHVPEALLLHGHILQNLHRFKEAESLARELVASRGRPFDYGLLGDVLMEQGQLNEAVEAYQKMADLRPDLQAYARAAHIRWLKGDLDGAIEMMRLAIQAASPLDAESAAWVYSRMAVYQMQSGALAEARNFCEGALEFQSNYPPALLVEGKLSFAKGKTDDALESIRRAVALNPLPEYQWALIEALQADGRFDEATSVKNELKANGAAADPRTVALFLATSGEEPSQALRLARAELLTRKDVFSYDALAWGLAACDQWDEARIQSEHALAEGTRDARLFLHAGIIAAHVGRADEARTLLIQAESLHQMLLPSEGALLAKYLQRTLSLPQAVRFQTSQN